MEFGNRVRSYSELVRSYREGSKSGSLWSGFKTTPKLHNFSLVLDLMLSKASGIATLDQLSPVFIMSLTCKAKNAGRCKS